jgi:hypothetical protein
MAASSGGGRCHGVRFDLDSHGNPQSAEQRGFFRQQFYTESPCAKMVTHSSVEPPL